MGHTPEPWYVDSSFIVSSQGGMDMRVNVYDVDPCNRDRIVACVNACGGYSKVNGEWVKTHERMADPAGEIARLRAERDSLRAEVLWWRECQRQGLVIDPYAAGNGNAASYFVWGQLQERIKANTAISAKEAE